MIELETADGTLRIRPIKDTCNDEIAALYNSNADMRYATGAGCSVTTEDTADAIERLSRSGNEFISGIYISGAVAGQNKFIGIVSGTLMGKTLWIRQLAIHPGYRRQGLGTRAAGLILQYARERYNTEQAFLSVVEDNAAGLKFWSKLGFTLIKRINKVLFDYERPYWIVIMQKKL